MDIKKYIDINSDLGELFPPQDINYDSEIMPYISSCNIACGGHAGNVITMSTTLDLAIKHKVAIGAHPSYVDRENFGRKSLKQSLEKTMRDCRQQILLLDSIAKKKDAELHHIKPHGALYNDIATNEQLATSFIKLAKEINENIVLYLMAGSRAVELCRAEGMIVKEEVFADRNYENKTALRSRDLANAVVHDVAEVIEKISSYLKNELILYNGISTSINADTICVHSDTPQAVQLCKATHNHLKKTNVRISAHK